MAMFSPRNALLLAGFASALFASAAQAQDYGPAPSYDSGPPESVTVTAPHFREEPRSSLLPLEKVSLSSGVSYSDLDLRTRSGAYELRHRVRQTAHDVCRQLAEAYPFYTMPGTHCYRDAVLSGMRHANAAIEDARESRYN
jgi:UrcA family protein